jgi:RNA polymerase sigma factor (sigma-70 family)
VEQERSNEELCMLAKQGDDKACLQLLKQNRAYIVLQMTKIGFRYHPYWQEMIEWGEVGILSSIQDYDPSYGTTFLTFATYRIETELRNFLHSIRMAYTENYYPDDEDEEGEWAGEEFCFRSNSELRPLEKMFLNERRDLLLDASMEKLPELERKYIEYRYGFATGKPMSRSEIAKILDVPEAEVKRIEADALNYLRGCFHVDNVSAFYEVRPEAKLQKELAQKSQEALFDNFAGTHVDMLLAQFGEEDD